MSKLKTPIWWVGGKHYLAKKIIPYFPEHITYVEMFGGGASVLLQKSPSKIEIFNDINGDLINFFRVLRDKEKFKEFYETVNLIPYSRQEYNENRDSLHEGLEVERAIKFFIIAKMSFGGNFGSSWGYVRFLSRNNKSSVVNTWLNAIKLLPEISNRLKEVQIDNRDYKIIMKYFNDPNIFIYADPPYLNVRSKNLTFKNWTEKQHEEFLNLCLNSNSKIMISGYNSGLYDDKLNNWDKKTFKNSIKIPKYIDEESDYVEECIWINYYNKEKNYKFKTLMDF